MPSFAEMLVAQSGQPIEHKLDNVGQNFMQGFGTGAELAIKKESLAHQQQELALKKQQLDDSKDETFIDRLDKISKINGLTPKQKTDLARKTRDGMNLGERYNDTLISMAFTDPLIVAKIKKMRSDMMDGKLPRDKYYATLQDEIATNGYTPELKEAMDEGFDAEKVMHTDANAKASRDAEQYRYLNTQNVQAKQELDSRATDLNDKVQKRFGELGEVRDIMLDSKVAVVKMQKDLREGKPINELELNKVLYGLARAAQGPGILTEKDLKNLTSQSGAASMADEAFRKWVVGGVSDKKLKLILGSLDSGLKNADSKIKSRAKSFEPLFQSERYPGESQELKEKSGLATYMRSSDELFEERGFKKKEQPGVIPAGTPPTNTKPKFSEAARPMLENLKAGVAKNPKDRQRVIQGLVNRFDMTVQEAEKLLGGE